MPRHIDHCLLQLDGKTLSDSAAGPNYKTYWLAVLLHSQTNTILSPVCDAPPLTYGPDRSQSFMASALTQSSVEQAPKKKKKKKQPTVLRKSNDV